MAQLLNRSSIRALVLVRVLAIALGLGLLILHSRTRPAQAQAADPTRASVILNWLAALNQGDANAAASMFADSTFFVTAAPVGACSSQAPCYDLASALKSLQATDTGTHLCITLTDVQVDGGIVNGRWEVRNDAIHMSGLYRAVVAFMAEIWDGKIFTLVSRNDLADPQTALRNAISAGTAQAGTPIPTPNPVCG
jgi:hypothetical protein